MTIHLASNKMAWCGSKEPSIYSKGDFLMQVSTGGTICKNCFRKATEKHLVINLELHTRLKVASIKYKSVQDFLTKLLDKQYKRNFN